MYPFYVFSCLIGQELEVYIEYIESRQPCLVPYLEEYLHISIHVSLWACYKLPLLFWGMFLVPLVAPRLLSQDSVIICQRPFLHLTNNHVDLSFNIYVGLITFPFYICWTMPVSQGYSLFDQCGWSFWHVLAISC